MLSRQRGLRRRAGIHCVVCRTAGHGCARARLHQQTGAQLLRVDRAQSLADRIADEDLRLGGRQLRGGLPLRNQLARPLCSALERTGRWQSLLEIRLAEIGPLPAVAAPKGSAIGA
jgi:hypothetical protein